MFTLSNLHLLTPGNSVHLKVSILFRVYFIFTFYGVLRLFNRLTDIFVLLSLNVSLCYSCTRAYIRIRCNALTFRLLLKLLSSEKLGKVEISLCIGLTGKIFQTGLRSRWFLGGVGFFYPTPAVQLNYVFYISHSSVGILTHAC